MNCEHAVDLIIDSLLDELDDRQRVDLERHVQSCESCQAEAERLAAVWRGLGQVGLGLSEGRVRARSGGPSVPRFGRHAPLLRTAAAIALILLGGAGGYLLGRDGSPAESADVGPAAAAPAGAERFLLLVRGEDPQGPVTGDRLVREYQAWAASLARQGRLVGANKLMDEPGRWISAPMVEETRRTSDVSGYFLISASGYDEAVAIAESSPHIKYGGTFEIRQIDPLE
jgi:hypothetical protein